MTQEIGLVPKTPIDSSGDIPTREWLRFFDSLRKAIMEGTGLSTTQASLILTDLTTTRLVKSDSNKKLVSLTNLADFVAGTANQVTITNDGDGTITISLPQDYDTDATPTLGGLTLSGNLALAANSITGTSVDISNAELQQLSNIGSATISSAQWDYLGATGAGGGQLLAALTTGESTQLEAIGSTTITATQWGYLGSSTTAGGAIMDAANAAAQLALLSANAGAAFDMNAQKISNMANAVDIHDAMTLEDVLNTIGVSLNYWEMPTSLLSQDLTISSASATEVITGTPQELTTADTFFKSTVAGTPTPFVIKNGAIILTHIEAKVESVSGKKPVTLHTELWIAASGGAAESQIGSDSDATAVLTEAKTLYELHVHVPTETIVASGKRLFLRIFAATTGATQDPTVRIYNGDVHDHVTIPVSGSVLGRYLQLVGGTMTGDIAMGGLQQVTGLQAPAASGEAIRQTSNITEANLETLNDTSDASSLHDHGSIYYTETEVKAILNGTGYFERSGNDIQPITSLAAFDPYYDLDSNGDIQPRDTLFIYDSNDDIELSAA